MNEEQNLNKSTKKAWNIAILRLGVCYFALRTFQVYHNYNRQNYSTNPLLVAGAVK
jgi:hypothetical protein